MRKLPFIFLKEILTSADGGVNGQVVSDVAGFIVKQELLNSSESPRFDCACYSVD